MDSQELKQALNAFVTEHEMALHAELETAQALLNQKRHETDELEALVEVLSWMLDHDKDEAVHRLENRLRSMQSSSTPVSAKQVADQAFKTNG